jgi:inorganic triphosphatase YgiF
MSGPKEVELKFELAPTGVRQLKDLPLLNGAAQRPRSETEVSVYFDTPKLKLRKNGLTLRVRRVGKRHIQTIKSAGNSSLFERNEWESEIEGDKPDLRAARGTAIESFLTKKFRRQLRPVFQTRVRRTTYPLANGASNVVLTLDRGKIDTGRRSAPLCEIELELKRGEQSALFGLARQLTHTLPAQLAIKSKSERGYDLVENRGITAEKGGPVHLQSGMTTREAFRAIGHACLKQVIANEPAVLAGDADGVHQMRIGLRRLRAAISLFPEILSDAQTDKIKKDLKWLSGELGPLRELDVFVTRVVTPVKRRYARRQGMPGLSSDFEQRRTAALERAQNALRSPRYRTVALNIAAWLETGDWAKPQDDLIRGRGEVPIETSAAAQLARRWKKIRKRGKSLAELNAGRRHKLRIQAKKVRYAAEFFADTFPGKKATKRREAFLAALKGMQDCLGDLNDIVVHESLTTDIAKDGKRRKDKSKRAFAAGLLTGREDARLDAVLSAAGNAYDEFAKVKPFWK